MSMTEANKIILVIITIIVILASLGAMASTIIKSSTDITTPNLCNSTLGVNNEVLVYNETGGACYNFSGTCPECNRTASTVDAGVTPLPLSGLFAGNGVVLLILMVAILLGLIALGLQHLKNR